MIQVHKKHQSSWDVKDTHMCKWKKKQQNKFNHSRFITHVHIWNLVPIFFSKVIPDPNPSLVLAHEMSIKT